MKLLLCEPPTPAVLMTDLGPLFYTYFEIVSAETPEALRRAQELRYQVYVVERRFEDPAAHADGIETDDASIGETGTPWSDKLGQANFTGDDTGIIDDVGQDGIEAQRDDEKDDGSTA